MLEIIANAKINLFLEITGKLQNGYHTVDTVMQSVSLSDRIILDVLPLSNGIIITCDKDEIPVDGRNIAYKAAKAYLDEINADCGVRLDIKKAIPSEAGMGGGSADGAGVLLGLNVMCGNPLTADELCRLASRIGADIPFCIMGGTKRMQGTGTDFAESYRTPRLDLLVVKPPVGISTPTAYRCLDSIYSDFASHSPEKPNDRLFNRFEDVLPQLAPCCIDILNCLRENSFGALLSGSGTAMFAIAESTKHSHQLARLVNNKFPDCYTASVSTEHNGCIVK